MEVEKLGFVCPNCAAAVSKVNKTRKRRGFLMRRRECGACRFRFTTAEKVIGNVAADVATYRTESGEVFSPREFLAASKPIE